MTTIKAIDLKPEDIIVLDERTSFDVMELVETITAPNGKTYVILNGYKSIVSGICGPNGITLEADQDVTIKAVAA